MSEADVEGGAAGQCASAWKVKHVELKRRKRRHGHTHTSTYTSEGCLEPDGVRIFLPDQLPLLPDQWIQLLLQMGPPSHTSRACLLCWP